MIIIITIPFKTPTINHLYGQNGVRKYLKPEAKELREEIFEIVQKEYPGRFDCVEKLKVTVEIHENWLTKSMSVKRKDISNREKFLIDSVFDAIGIDDKYIYEHTMKKVQSEDEFAVIKIEVLK